MLLELLLKLFGLFKESSKETDSRTPWIRQAKKMMGTLEAPGDVDNKAIVDWPIEIANKYPEMESYCKNYNHDAIPWCGLFVATALTKANIKPMFGKGDLQRFLWAQSWKNFGQDLGKEAAVGAIAVLAGHVTFVVGQDQYGNIMCLGGNQSDAVNIKPFKRSSIQVFRWPDGYTIPDLDKELPVVTSDGQTSTKVT